MAGEWHKVIVVGSQSVGKSSFILRKQMNVFEETLTTKTIRNVFVETTHYFGTERFNLRLFECLNSGESSNFYLDAEAAIVICSRKQPETCRGIRNWIDQINSHCSRDRKIPIIICVNQTEASDEGVDFSRIEKQVNIIPSVEGCVETSAKNGLGIEEVFDMLVRAIKKRGPLRKKRTDTEPPDDPSIEQTPWLCCCFLFP